MQLDFKNLENIDWSTCKICVLQPDYSTTNVDYKNYDPVRNLSSLIPEAHIDHVLLNKLTTYKQLQALAKNKYDIFVNLCESYLEWEVPSIDVIHTLDLLNLPYTGPNAILYDPPKELMKYVAFCEGVHTPGYALIESIEDLWAQCAHLNFPLFVKPSKAGDSLGVDDKSLVHNEAELSHKVATLLNEFDQLMVEEYIKGREFTVMVAATAGANKFIKCFKPVEYIFPDGYEFKTYALKTSELHLDANVPVNNIKILNQLETAATAIFKGFNGEGYGRMDFRMDDKGVLYFLEINFTCSVFYSDGYEGSADYILKYDGFGQANFLKQIIAEGIWRHRQKQKKYVIKGNSIAGYGIYAAHDFATNDLIFKGEEMAQRMVTKRYVEENWNIKEKDIFRKYAYPVSNEVFLLWGNNPDEWAPQNHCCNANTAYQGLNVVATRPIKKGEELTLDYAAFLDEHMEPFNCQCGTPACRGLITGIPGNSVTKRENKRQS